MAKRKRKLKIKNIILFFIFIVFTIFLIFIMTQKNDSKLEKIGYNSLEIKEIKKLTDEEINTIYNYKYNNNLINIIKNKNYNSKNLNLYLKYTLKYKNIDYLKIFNLINNKDFNEKYINKYIKYIENYDNIDNIVNLINKNPNFDGEINDIISNFINEKYFIIDYLDRYLKYFESHKDLEYKEIVTRVNSNLDYDFYTNTKEADLTKEMYTLVNKYYYLSNDYVPNDLVDCSNTYSRGGIKLQKVAYENFIKMADYMKELDMGIKIISGYRSYYSQSSIYNNYVNTDGVKNADTYSARPGFSEHQFGYSADLTNNNNASFDEFEYTNEYKWLKDNAHKFGFIIRYPEGKEYITGYIFEPWHIRYVGVDIATYIYENDITYEEYYAYFLR